MEKRITAEKSAKNKLLKYVTGLIIENSDAWKLFMHKMKRSYFTNEHFFRL